MNKSHLVSLQAAATSETMTNSDNLAGAVFSAIGDESVDVAASRVPSFKPTNAL